MAAGRAFVATVTGCGIGLAVGLLSSLLLGLGFAGPPALLPCLAFFGKAGGFGLPDLPAGQRRPVGGGRCGAGSGGCSLGRGGRCVRVLRPGWFGIGAGLCLRPSQSLGVTQRLVIG